MTETPDTEPEPDLPITLTGTASLDVTHPDETEEPE